MLLRHALEHVSEQKSKAVGLDSCIVVIGLFIGIQDAKWNDERNTRRALDTALDQAGFFQDQGLTGS